MNEKAYDDIIESQSSESSLDDHFYCCYDLQPSTVTAAAMFLAALS